ncbi:HAMP domain-containing protein [Massilia sp. S19_KUP03_FR1]|uniref:HAMP domain-containing protein n=1 Tax=Massilia sp. S19_KUP03_FR1 TaxID=3025503 RepID=UPI002FCDC0F1
MTSKFTLNIFHKVVATLLAVTLIPLCTLWYVSNNTAERELSTNIFQNLVATMDITSARINGWDDSNLRVLRQAGRLNDINGMKSDRQVPVLTAIGQAYDSYLVFTIAPDGSNIARNDGGALVSYADRSYFKDVMKGAPVGRQVVISKTTGRPSLLLGSPIRSDENKLIGVIAMGLNLGDISQAVADVRVGETGHAILLDATNKVIAHGDAQKVKTALQDFSAHSALKTAGITDGPTAYRHDGKEMIGYMRKLPQGWTLLVEQDYDEAFAPLAQMKKEGRLLIIITIALVAAIAYMLGKALTRPINELTIIADKLSKGDFDVNLTQVERGDEIGSLARAIERLGISIKMAMDRLRSKS